jgi:hypothetical protein
MRNGYILLTEVLMDMQKMRGTVIQAGQRLFGTSDPKAHAAATELEDIPRRVQAAMDILVEVQGLMPEPTKGDIVRHYNPDAVDIHAGQTFDDKRPAGWTEALALEFLSDGTDGPEEFAKSFLHGDWPTIQKEWPEFQTFINKQLEGYKMSLPYPAPGEMILPKATHEAILNMEEGPVGTTEEPAKPEHYDQWISSECMMLLKGLTLIDKAGLIELGLPRDKLDLVGRVLEDQRKRLTDSLAKKLDKVVLPHVE